MSRISQCLMPLYGAMAAMSMANYESEEPYQRSLSNVGEIKHTRCDGAETPKKVKKGYGQKKMTKAQRKRLYAKKG